jgi:hypothetical protein
VSDVAALTELFRRQDAVVYSCAPPPDPDVRAFVFAAIEAGHQRMETIMSYVPHGMAAHDAHVKSRIDAQTSGTNSIIAAAKAAGVKRVLAVGGAGTLLVGGVRTMDPPEFPKAFEGRAKSTTVVKELLHHEHDMDWTVIPSHGDRVWRTHRKVSAGLRRSAGHARRLE